MKLTSTLAAAAAVGLLAAATASPMGPTKLVGTVGPGFTITLTKAGKKVTTLPAGTYTFVIADRSAIHNFELQGPSPTRSPIKVVTTVPFTGSKTVTVVLKKGKYRYFCAPHASQMFGLVTIT